MRILVLGGGLVGGPMARDLATDERFEVTVADASERALSRVRARSPRVQTVHQDLSGPAEVTRLVSNFDWALNAVPGFMGYRTLEAILQAGKSVVDIAFFPEDPFELDALAREKGSIAVVDCGVAPGMSNLLSGYVDSLLDETESILIYVGGLPELREWPYEYRAGFSPVDVLEEYTRPARYVEHGHLVVRPALSDAELIDFPGIGTLEAFNSDGLRSLAHTLAVPNMKEKTLRYPGHIEKMAVLRASGFFSKDPIEINGTSVRPLDFTSKLLFPMWELEDGMVDLTIMQVIVEGTRQGRKVRYTYDLLDRYDEATGVHSMARTTGYTATSVLRMLIDGIYTEPGISPPEYLGRQEGCAQAVLAGLKSRNIEYRLRVE